MPTPDSGGDWGVLGGSFDPVHNGHIHIAKSISLRKKLTGVLFVPAFKHPFKESKTVATYLDRLEMLKLALENDPNLLICEIEREEDLSGFTFDTVCALKKRYPNVIFHFIIGLDLFSQIKDWHRSNELLKEISFLVGSRPKVNEDEMKSKLIDNFQFVDIPEVDISASDIRTRIKNGAGLGDIEKLVPNKVAEFIFKKGLYR
jgi:nicotinate-nucleotide adenylyltransferase